MRIIYRLWLRRLSLALVLGGTTLFAQVASGGPLDTNLVVNPSFENVNTGIAGPFGSVRVLDWTGDASDTFAYAYSLGYSGNPAPPGSGTYHFTGGFNTAVDQVQMAQTIDVSTGATAGAIAAGTAQYNLGAYFSTYRQQSDFSIVRALFLDDGGTGLGSAEVGGAEFRATLPLGLPQGGSDQVAWGLDTTLGTIPIGTRSVVIQILAAVGTTNHDGYVDLVDFSISSVVVPEPGSGLALLVGAGLLGTLALGRRSRRD